MTDARHSDQVSRVDAPTASTTTSTQAGERKSVDNDEQVDRAIAARERTYTTGGGIDPSAPVSPTIRVEQAIARIRMPERPSPFGTTHFPPLPAPPERTRG